MAFLTESEIRAKFNIEPNRFQTQIEAAIASATRKLRRWVSAEAFTSAADTTIPSDPDELVRYDSLIDAHAFLTMYYFAVSVGSRFVAAGVIKSAQDAGSPAVPGGMITNAYLTPAELAAKQQEFYAEAKDIVEPYLTVVLTDEGVIPYPAAAAVTVASDW